MLGSIKIKSSASFAFTLFDGIGIHLGFRFDLLLENKEDLARIMVLEQGKPLSEAIGEVYSSIALPLYS